MNLRIGRLSRPAPKPRQEKTWTKSTAVSGKVARCEAGNLILSLVIPG
jgi:hypothetical protein